VNKTGASIRPVAAQAARGCAPGRDSRAFDTGEPVRPLQLSGDPISPQPWEKGWKDTVVALPGRVTRIKMWLKTAGQFVWHCHIAEHEDNEMMRPYRIGPAQPGQPDA
jgi:spore coat protein A, manganese oxidase